MTAEESGVFDVERLRRDFDAAFAQPHAKSAGAAADYLLLRAGGRPYAVALAEIGAVLAGAAVTPVPSTAAGLLGVAGLRGAIVPVFELAALLGGGAQKEAGRWLLLSAGAEPIGFAFDVLAGHLRRRREELLADGAGGEGLYAGAGEREDYHAIIGIERLVATIRERSSQGHGKET